MRASVDDDVVLLIEVGIELQEEIERVRIARIMINRHALQDAGHGFEPTGREGLDQIALRRRRNSTGNAAGNVRDVTYHRDIGSVFIAHTG